jgi:hypothetical protein
VNDEQETAPDRAVIRLHHQESGREIPVESLTVFGRAESYHRYDRADEQGHRLSLVEDALSVHTYIKVDDDIQISRTHGLLDPNAPGLSDLNSKNGTFLNGRLLARDFGRQGPLSTLENGDVISIGKQRFDVSVHMHSHQSICRQAPANRHAVIGCDPKRLGRAGRLAGFLSKRKGFQEVNIAPNLENLTDATFALPDHVDHEALVVLAICAEARGTEIILGDSTFPLEGLLAFFREVPGRKVLALELQGDPSACEALFRDVAREDMVLLTSPGEVSLEEHLETNMQSLRINQLRDSVCGRSPAGAFDDLRDGLDALITADTNILNTDWVEGYDGRLGLIFGHQEPPPDSWVVHSLRFGGTDYFPSSGRRRA